MSMERQPEIVTIENKPSPVKKVFINADDKNVATVVIYTADGEVFTYDAEGEIEVNAADMFNLFIKGVVAVKNDVYYKPTSCTEAGVIEFPFPTV